MGRSLAGLPTPPATLIGGHLAELRRDRLGFFELAAKCGDFVPLRFGPRRILQINDPHAIEEVLVTKNRSFHKHFALKMTPSILGNGLLTSDGPHWLRQRRMAQPAFSQQKIASYGADFVSLTSEQIADWKDGEERDISREMMQLTLRIATRVLFSSEISGREQNVGQAIINAQHFFLKRFNSLIRFPLWMPTPANRRFNQLVKELNDIVYGLIRARRHDSRDRGDLLSMLLHAQDEDDQGRMTDRQLRDEVMTLFLAGHETTAQMLSWTWRALAQNPRILEKLQNEIEREVGDRPPTPADPARMPYLEQVLLEALRLYPSAYLIGREAIENCEIGGYDIPRGMTIWTCQWTMHRDPRFWDDPLEFRPERWESDPLAKQPRIIYFPFGAGPRVCIGNTFAMLEAGLILITLMQQVRIQLNPGQNIKPIAAFTLRPNGPIRFTVEKHTRLDRSAHVA